MWRLPDFSNAVVAKSCVVCLWWWFVYYHSTWTKPVDIENSHSDCIRRFVPVEWLLQSFQIWFMKYCWFYLQAVFPFFYAFTKSKMAADVRASLLVFILWLENSFMDCVETLNLVNDDTDSEVCHLRNSRWLPTSVRYLLLRDNSRMIVRGAWKLTLPFRNDESMLPIHFNFSFLNIQDSRRHLFIIRFRFHSGNQPHCWLLSFVNE